MTHAPVSLGGPRCPNPRQKRRAVLAFAALGAAFSACSGRSQSSGQFLGSPTVHFVGVQNGDGARFSAEEEAVTLACDRNLTFEIGPRTDGVTLDNWSLRPKGYCSSRAVQCGYFRIAFFDVDGKTIFSRESANLFPVVTLPAMDLNRIAGATITLIDGSDDEPWDNDDALVKDENEGPREDTWSFTLSVEDCGDPPSGGGMGGMMTTPNPVMGGMGGLGGAGLGGALTGE